MAHDPPDQNGPEGASMKNFIPMHLPNALTVIVNTNYVVQIQPSLDPHDPTTVRMANGDTFSLSAGEGSVFIGQLNKCCEPAKPGTPGKGAPGRPGNQGRTAGRTPRRMGEGTRRSRR
jgi:hypothetical protein